jgi:hypothetical protein
VTVEEAVYRFRATATDDGEVISSEITPSTA